MINLPVSKKVLAAIGIPSTILFLYWLLWQKDDDEDFKTTERKATSKQTVIEIKVPKNASGAIIGRQGSQIKEIQKTSGAKVYFCDDDRQSEERLVRIRGSSECAQHAEIMIREIVANMLEIFTEEIQISSKAIGRVIGKGGATIRNISSSSNARVYVDRTEDNYKDVNRKIQITGTKQQIDLAKVLIQERVEEEEVFRARKAVMEANRERRPCKSSGNLETTEKVFHNGEKNSASSDSLMQTSPSTSNASMTQMFEWPQGSKEYIEVYVSSVANPTTFWVQLLSSLSLQLDDLVQNMTIHYSTNEGQSSDMSDFSEGTIVAAPFDQDSSWYRAKVMGYQGDKVDLYYVDYGDSCYLEKDRIRSIRSDFLALPYQAVECELANARPIGDSWSEDVIDKFEELTHSAKWKIIFAKRKRTKHLPGGEKIEVIELIDTSSEQDINVGEELVAQGLAVWSTDEESPQISG